MWNRSPVSPSITNQVSAGCPYDWPILYRIKEVSISHWRLNQREKGINEQINNLFPEIKLWSIMLLQNARMLVFLGQGPQPHLGNQGKQKPEMRLLLAAQNAALLRKQMMYRNKPCLFGSLQFGNHRTMATKHLVLWVKNPQLVFLWKFTTFFT